MKKTLLAATLIASFAAPAFAADTYYIVQDKTTKKCSIVEQKPTVETTTIVGDGTVYKTRTEAETGMKTVKICTSM